MSYRAAAQSAANGDEHRDARIAFQAVLGIWAYAAVCGALAVGVGYIAAAAVGTSLPAAWVGFGAAGIAVVIAGLSGDRVLERIANWLPAPYASRQDRSRND